DQVVGRVEVRRRLLTERRALERQRLRGVALEHAVRDSPVPGAGEAERLRGRIAWRDRLRERGILVAVGVRTPLVRGDDPPGPRRGRDGLAGVDRAGALREVVVAEVVRGRLQD